MMTFMDEAEEKLAADGADNADETLARIRAHQRNPRLFISRLRPRSVLHEKPPVQSGAESLRQFSQNFQEMPSLLVITENRPAFVAAGRYMIPSSRPLNS